MRGPQTIGEYLADFNAFLEVGFRSRRRIFLEVSDHLWQAVARELEAGASPAVAERRAAAAFGSPEEVARSFEAGLVGALDKRLAVTTRRIHRWMTRHPWGAAVIKAAVVVLILGVVASVGAFVGANDPLGALWSFLFIGIGWVLCFSPQAPLRGRLQGRSLAAPWRRLEGPAKERAARTRRQYRGPNATRISSACTYPMVWTWLIMADETWWGRPVWQPVGVFLFLEGGRAAVARATDRAVDLVARRRARATGDASRGPWEAEQRWRAALLEIWSFPLASLALVLLYPSPLELRGSFAALLVAGTALAAACLCLLRSLQEKDYYAHYYARRFETRT